MTSLRKYHDLVGREGRLDLASPGPLYDHAYRALRAEIERGALGDGDRLASERVLASRVGVSRVTLRRALKELVECKLIEADPRRGYRIRARKLDEPATALISFTEMAASRGLTPSSRVLRSRVRPADLEEADRLRLPPGGSGVRTRPSPPSRRPPDRCR